MILITKLLVFTFQRLNTAAKFELLTSLNLGTNPSRLRMTWSTEPLGYSLNMKVLMKNIWDLLSVWFVSHSARNGLFSNQNGSLCVFWLVLISCKKWYGYKQKGNIGSVVFIATQNDWIEGLFWFYGNRWGLTGSIHHKSDTWMRRLDAHTSSAEFCKVYF